MPGSKAKARTCGWCDRAITIPDLPCAMAEETALRMLVAHPRGNPTCKLTRKSRGI